MENKHAFLAYNTRHAFFNFHAYLVNIICLKPVLFMYIIVLAENNLA